MSERVRGAPYTPQEVLEADLGRPDEILDAHHARALRVLVRIHGAPVGWLRIMGDHTFVTREKIISNATVQLDVSALAVALREQLFPDNPDEPSISIVVCSRNRTESLRRCLESLAALNYSAFEVIVVDNAPTSDATERLVAQYARDGRIRYVRENQPGLDWARNRGLAEARYDIVAYTDDDVRVDSAWLRGFARGFSSSDTVLVTGLVAPGELATDAQVVFEDWYGGMGKGTFPFSYQRDELNNVKQIGAHHVGVGANMAFRRDWLTSVGGFDTALDVGTPSHGAGDLDAFERAIMSGHVVRYEPTALVWHYHRRELSGLRKQLRDNGRAFGVYLISRWLQRGRPGRQVLSYALTIWIGWMVGRMVRRLLGRERMPIHLQACEWWGALQAPWAYFATYRHDARVRREAAHAETASPRSQKTPHFEAQVTDAR